MLSYSLYDDYHLLVLIKERDDANAYTTIFDRYSSLIYSHVYNKLRNRQDAEDVVQEIFIKFWNKRRDMDLNYKFPGYLFLLARNQVIDVVRKKKAITVSEDFYIARSPQDQSSTDFLLREKEFSALIEYEISMLPPRMREAFDLRRKQYLSVKQISEEMGISEQTAATQIKKAIKILRSKLKKPDLFLFLL